jgi:hypothetical protein
VLKITCLRYGAAMSNSTDHKKLDTPALIEEWRLLHPEFTNEDWNYAMNEVKHYIKIAWQVYREAHPDWNLPETL